MHTSFWTWVYGTLLLRWGWSREAISEERLMWWLTISQHSSCHWEWSLTQVFFSFLRLKLRQILHWECTIIYNLKLVHEITIKIKITMTTKVLDVELNTSVSWRPASFSHVPNSVCVESLSTRVNIMLCIMPTWEIHQWFLNWVQLKFIIKLEPFNDIHTLQDVPVSLC